MSRREIYKIIENKMILCWEQSGSRWESVWLNQQKSYHLQILKLYFSCIFLITFIIYLKFFVDLLPWNVCFILLLSNIDSFQLKALPLHKMYRI